MDEKMVMLTEAEQAAVPFAASANAALWHGGEWVYADYDGEVAMPIQDEDQSGDYVPVDVAELIAGRLSPEDVEAWHQCEMTDNAQDLIDTFGDFQVWGSHDGPEPLTVTLL